MTALWIAITILIYWLAKRLFQKVLTPLATPVFTSTVAIIALLGGTDTSYDEYIPAKNAITFLLGPATVALAVPLYYNRALLMQRLIPSLAGLAAGTIATIASAVWIAAAFGLPKTIQAAAAVKAVTTPVAIEAAVIIEGDPALAAAFVVTAGIFGAMFGPAVLTFLRIEDFFSRGLAMGTVAHGIGTSQAAAENALQGAVASAAMGVAAILTSLIIPWFFPLL